MVRTLSIIFSAGLIVGSLAQARQDSRDVDESRDEEPIVFTNADLPPAPEPRPAPPAPPGGPPKSAPPPSLPSYSEHRDVNGHGEGWWRHRVLVKDAEVIKAQIETHELNVKYLRGKQIEDPTLGKRLVEATERMKRIEAERAEIPEEFRRAGGMPAWLRPSGRPLASEPPPPPVLRDPNFGDGVTFTWGAVRDAGFYFVEAECLDCCGMLGPCGVSLLDVSRPSATFQFENAGSVRWRVCTLDPSGFAGDWSDWRTDTRPE